MDKVQAEKIAQAILEPGIRVQTEIHSKRAEQMRYTARKRRVVWFTLMGCSIGAVAAYFVDGRVIQGTLWGGIAGTSIGLLVMWLRRS